MTHEQALLSRFVTSFLEGDNQSCLRMVPQMDPVETPLIIRLMTLVVFQREKMYDLVEQISEVWDSFDFPSPFSRSLAGMLFGKVSLEQLLLLASNDAERGEAYFFAGEAAITSGDLETAIHHLGQCARLDIDTNARQIGEKHVALIANAEVLKAFRERNYQKARDLAISAGKVLAESVAVSFLSMQRLGELGRQSHSSSQSKHTSTFESNVVQLVLGELSLDQALSNNLSPEQQCFLRFCYGARLRTLLRDDEARVALQSAVDMKVACHGATLAQAELTSLDSWQRIFETEVDVTSVTSACYNGFTRGDYWQVIDVAKAIALNAAPRTLVLIYLISQQRLKRVREVEEVRSAYLDLFNDEFSKEIIKVALNGVLKDKALDLASNDPERCSAYFYSAAWLDTSNRRSTSEWISAAICPLRPHSLSEAQGGPKNDERQIARTIQGLDEGTDNTAHECLQAFGRQDYDATFRRGLEWLESRSATTTDLLPLHSTLIALERLGHKHAVEVIGQGVLADPNLDSKDQYLLRLSLGLATFAEVKEHVVDAHLRTQAAFLAGAHLATLGRRQEAILILREAVAAPVESKERLLARQELVRLDPTFLAEVEFGRITKPWQRLKVFVSSTFRDMHAEREHLVRVVFPRLRQFCAKRRIFLDDVDLRWGVGEEENSLERIGKEVLSCHIFICLLGQRYGWCLLPQAISPSVLSRSPELPALFPGGELRHNLTNSERHRAAELLDDAGLSDALQSITAREIDFALSSQHGPLCFFYFRDPALTQSVPESHAADYLSESLWTEKRLEELKSQIRNQQGQKVERVHTYGAPAQWSDSAVQAWEPSFRGCFVQLHEFGKEMLADLEGAVERLTPAIEHYVDLDEQDVAMEAVVQEHLRGRVFAGRAEVLQALLEFATRDEANRSHRLACVHGPSGSGKSALFARLSSALSEQSEVLVLWHFVGATPESTVPVEILKRLGRKLGADEKSLYEAGSDENKLRTLVEQIMEEACRQRRVVVLLDGLDQLDSSEDLGLHWLPLKLSRDCRMIISVIHQPGSELELEWAYQAVQQLDISVHLVELGPLLPEDRKVIIDAYLDIYGKSQQSIAPEDVAQLVQKPEAGLPLYLLLALDELRTAGGNELHRKIRDHIKTLPQTAHEIFLRILNRLVLQNYEYPGLVEIILLAIYLSRSRGGVTERELNLFAEQVCETQIEGPHARVLMGLRPYLVERPDERQNLRISFFHDQLFEAVAKRFDLHDEETKRKHHHRLAKSILSVAYTSGSWEGRSDFRDLMYRLTVELLHHLRLAHEFRRLASVLCDLRFISTVCQTGQAKRLVAEYTESLASWPGNQTRNPFAELTKPPAWLRECTKAVLAGQNDTHLDKGSGPQWRLLRGSPQQTVALTIWDLRQGRMTSRLEGHLWDVICVVITPDAGCAVSASADGTVRVWDIGSGKCLHILTRHEHSISSLDLTDDGRYALSVDSDGLLCCWDLHAGLLLESLKTDIKRIHLDADGRKAIGVGERHWVLFDCVEHTTKREYESQHCFSSASAKLADCLITAHSKGIIRVWNTRLQTRVSDLYDYACDKQPEVTCLAITPDGQFIVSGSADNTLRMWDAIACDLLQVIPTTHETFRTIAITPDGGRAISAGTEGAVCVWDLRSGACVFRIQQDGLAPSAIAMSADGRTAVVGTDATELRKQRFEPPHAVALPQLSPQQQMTLNFLRPDKPAQRDETATQLPGPERRALERLSRVKEFSRFVSTSLDDLLAPDCDPVALAYNRSGSEVIATRAARLLERRKKPWLMSEWNSSDSGRSALTATLLAHRGLEHSDFWKVSASADGLTVACLAVSESSVQVWDLRTNSLRFTLRNQSSKMTELAMSSSGRLILAGCEDGSVRAWDSLTGKGFKSLNGGPGAIQRIRLSGDDLIAVSVSEKGTLCIWDLRKGIRVRQMQAPHGFVNGLAITADARVGVTSSHRKEHTVWDLANGMPLRTFYHEVDYLRAEALTPDGKFVVSSHWGRVWIWETLGGAVLLDSKREGSLETVSDDGASGLWSSNGWLELCVLMTNEIISRVKVTGWAIKRSTLSANGTVAITAAVDTDKPLDPSMALLSWDLSEGRSDDDTRLVYPLRGVARSPGEGMAAYVPAEDHFVLADLSSATVLRRFDTSFDRSGQIHCLAIAPNGRTLASGNTTKTIDLWDIPSGQLLFSLGKPNNFDIAQGHIETVQSLAFSPDGSLLLSGSQDNTVRVWDLRSKTCRSTLGAPFSTNSLQSHWMAVVGVAISPDGRQAASAGLDGLIHIWDLVYGVSQRRLGDDNFGDGGISVNAVLYTPDGRFLIAAMADRTIRIWDCRDGECLAVHSTPDPVVALQCLTPSGRILCSNIEHRVWAINLRNFDLGLPIVTAGLQWFPNRTTWSGPAGGQGQVSDFLFGSEDEIPGTTETSPAFWCPYCRGRSSLRLKTLDLIQELERSADSHTGESLSLVLVPDKRIQSELVEKCQLCTQPLQFNPFLAR
jgi:WD40 repeat protein